MLVEHLVLILLGLRHLIRQLLVLAAAVAAVAATAIQALRQVGCMVAQVAGMAVEVAALVEAQLDQTVAGVEAMELLSSRILQRSQDHMAL